MSSFVNSFNKDNMAVVKNRHQAWKCIPETFVLLHIHSVNHIFAKPRQLQLLHISIIIQGVHILESQVKSENWAIN